MFKRAPLTQKMVRDPLSDGCRPVNELFIRGDPSSLWEIEWDKGGRHEARFSRTFGADVAEPARCYPERQVGFPTVYSM